MAQKAQQSTDMQAFKRQMQAREEQMQAEFQAREAQLQARDQRMQEEHEEWSRRPVSYTHLTLPTKA